MSSLQAAVRVSGLELGGLVGSLIAGRLSDWLISRSKQDGSSGNVGKRVQVRQVISGLWLSGKCMGGMYYQGTA